MRAGDLVKHVSDAHCNKFGVGIVTNIISMGDDGQRGIVKVKWAIPTCKHYLPSGPFYARGINYY